MFPLVYGRHFCSDFNANCRTLFEHSEYRFGSTSQSLSCRHSSDKVAKLESQVESYKKKLEDLGDLRRQVKLLEEKNTVYMQNNVSLEEELRKANAARSQLETYKRQVITEIVTAIVLYTAQIFRLIICPLPHRKRTNPYSMEGI